MSDDKVMQMLNYIKNLNRQLDSSIAVKEREIANGNPELLNSLRLSKEAGMSGSGLQNVGSKASQFLGRAINPQTLDNVQIKPEQGKKIAEAFEKYKSVLWEVCYR
jgi:hypothetical protein